MIGRNKISDDWRREKTEFGGASLRQWRSDRELTQGGLAALMGLSSPNAVRTIQDWEHGRTCLPDWARRMVWLMERVEEMAKELAAIAKEQPYLVDKGKYHGGMAEWLNPPGGGPVPRAAKPAARPYTKRSAEYWAKRRDLARGAAAEEPHPQPPN